VSIKTFPEYKHLLQENYMEYKHIFEHYLSWFLKFYVLFLLFVYVRIPRSFLVLIFVIRERLYAHPVLFSSNVKKNSFND